MNLRDQALRGEKVVRSKDDTDYVPEPGMPTRARRPRSCPGEAGALSQLWDYHPYTGQASQQDGAA